MLIAQGWGPPAAVSVWVFLLPWLAAQLVLASARIQPGSRPLVHHQFLLPRVFAVCSAGAASLLPANRGQSSFGLGFSAVVVLPCVWLPPAFEQAVELLAAGQVFAGQQAVQRGE